jgi:D-mannonate dehydratase
MPDDLTHDRVVLGENCKVEQLKSKINHYSYVSLTQLWFKLNMYTDELVKVALEKNKKYTLNYTPHTPHWKNASGISTIGIPRGVTEDNFG